MFLTALTIVVAWIAMGAQPASAHASLLSSDPAYGEVLTSAPEEVTLTFDNPVEPRLVKVRLMDAAGVEIGAGTAVELKMATELRFTLPRTPEGSFKISWQAFSYDGHVVGGVIAYSVGDAATGAAEGAEQGPLDAPSVPMDTGTQGNRLYRLLEMQLRVITYVAFSWVLGFVAWGALLRGAAKEHLGTLTRGTVAAAWVLAGSAVGRFAVTTLGAKTGLGGWGPAWRADATSGQLAWILATAAAVVAARRLVQAPAIVMGALCAYAFAAASTGHANGSGLLTGILAGAHLVAAGVWAGGVLVLAGVSMTRRWQESGGGWGALGEALGTYSKLMLAAGATLVSTGLRNSQELSGAVLGAGTWGLVLTVKLFAVAGAVLLGGWHLWRGRRGGQIGSSVQVEAAVLVVVLGAAALLAATPPL